jgi:hypothetical protein
MKEFEFILAGEGFPAVYITKEREDIEIKVTPANDKAVGPYEIRRDDRDYNIVLAMARHIEKLERKLDPPPEKLPPGIIEWNGSTK